MKILIVLFAVAVCALALPSDDKEEYKKKYREHINACIEETGTTKEVAEKLRNGDFSVRDEPAQCFVECFFKRVGFVNEKGEFLSDIIIEKLKKKPELKVENLEELIKKCVQEKGANKCETSFKVFECYRSQVTYST
ncbi:hypothetical protein PVAND_011904 [Polypedilum vanderplanki]|uniref:Odorant binding protein n=1 Tax=Polypedilum vanderplanki TaxID=319348 RepID=A0A9J6CL24_POLVA|nr:hypothetical protein PVAND_011904 [Polypedilum vanderplanki]